MSRGTHTLRTDLLLTVAGAEVEYAATITYYRHAAYDGGREEPSSDAYCEVEAITVDFDGVRWFLVGQICDRLQDDLQPALMDAWADDLVAAEEARADARRDDLLMERF